MPIRKRQGSPYWQYDFCVAGKQFRGSTKQITKARAQQVEAKLLHEQMNATVSDVRKPAPLLSDYAPRFLAHIRHGEIAAKTKAYYVNGWRLLAATDLSRMKMDWITAESVAATRFPGGGSNANNALRTLRHMLHTAVTMNVMPKALAFTLRKERAREEVIDAAGEAKLLAAATPTLHDVLLLILDTGMRPSEILSMAWVDVDFVRGEVFVPCGKTKAARRHVAMSTRVKEMLMRRAATDSAWVFPSSRRKGQHIGCNAVSQAFTKLKRRAGLDDRLVLYSGRHTFATDYIQSNGNISKLSKQMGHAGIAITSKYAHPDISDTGSIMDARNQRRGEDVHEGRLQ